MEQVKKAVKKSGLRWCMVMALCMSCSSVNIFSKERDVTILTQAFVEYLRTTRDRLFPENLVVNKYLIQSGMKELGRSGGFKTIKIMGKDPILDTLEQPKWQFIRSLEFVHNINSDSINTKKQPVRDDLFNPKSTHYMSPWILSADKKRAGIFYTIDVNRTTIYGPILMLFEKKQGKWVCIMEMISYLK